jgi:hypothetical protein
MACCKCCCEAQDGECCSDICCKEPDVCCGPIGSKECCEDPRACCGVGASQTCCPTGDMCCNESCCPEGRCCGSGSSAVCCNEGQYCCDGVCSDNPCAPCESDGDCTPWCDPGKVRVQFADGSYACCPSAKPYLNEGEACSGCNTSASTCDPVAPDNANPSHCCDGQCQSYPCPTCEYSRQPNGQDGWCWGGGDQCGDPETRCPEGFDCDCDPVSKCGAPVDGGPQYCECQCKPSNPLP